MSTLEDLLSLRDLTDPARGSHALQLVVDRAVGALRELWPCEVRVRRGERVVTVADNYDNLGYDPARWTTCCWCARESPTAAIPSTGCTPGHRNCFSRVTRLDRIENTAETSLYPNRLST
jgi:hypothetical protein